MLRSGLGRRGLFTWQLRAPLSGLGVVALSWLSGVPGFIELDETGHNVRAVLTCSAFRLWLLLAERSSVNHAVCTLLEFRLRGKQ